MRSDPSGTAGLDHPVGFLLIRALDRTGNPPLRQVSGGSQ